MCSNCKPCFSKCLRGAGCPLNEVRGQNPTATCSATKHDVILLNAPPGDSRAPRGPIRVLAGGPRGSDPACAPICTPPGSGVVVPTHVGVAGLRLGPGQNVQSQTPLGLVRSQTPLGHVQSQTPLGLVRSQTPLGHVRSQTFLGFVHSQTPPSTCTVTDTPRTCAVIDTTRDLFNHRHP